MAVMRVMRGAGVQNIRSMPPPCAFAAARALLMRSVPPTATLIAARCETCLRLFLSGSRYAAHGTEYGEAAGGKEA